jgi:hypothetical protein
LWHESSHILISLFIVNSFELYVDI